MGAQQLPIPFVGGEGQERGGREGCCSSCSSKAALARHLNVKLRVAEPLRVAKHHHLFHAGGVGVGEALSRGAPDSNAGLLRESCDGKQPAGRERKHQGSAAAEEPSCGRSGTTGSARRLRGRSHRPVGALHEEDVVVVVGVVARDRLFVPIRVIADDVDLVSCDRHLLPCVPERPHSRRDKAPLGSLRHGDAASEVGRGRGRGRGPQAGGVPEERRPHLAMTSFGRGMGAWNL